MKSHLQSYPCPLQINSFWNLGFLFIFKAITLGIWTQGFVIYVPSPLGIWMSITLSGQYWISFGIFYILGFTTLSLNPLWSQGKLVPSQYASFNIVHNRQKVYKSWLVHLCLVFVFWVLSFGIQFIWKLHQIHFVFFVIVLGY